MSKQGHDGRPVNADLTHLQAHWCVVSCCRVVSRGDGGLQGIAKGEVSIVIESAPDKEEKQPRRTHVKLPITLEIIPTPPRYVSSVPHTSSFDHSRLATHQEFHLQTVSGWLAAPDLNLNALSVCTAGRSSHPESQPMLPRRARFARRRDSVVIVERFLSVV